MKKRYVLISVLSLVLLISLTAACEGGFGMMDNRITDEDREFYADDAEEADFDFWRTVSVINKELGRENVKAAAQIAGKLLDIGVLGAVRAEWVRQDTTQNSFILEIESEDNKIYQLWIAHRTMGLNAIEDMETGESLYSFGNPMMPVSDPIPQDNLDFDLENTIQVLYAALSVDEKKYRSIRHYADIFFYERNIKGVIYAEMVEPTRNYLGSSSGIEIHLRIETEDNKHYLLVLFSDYGLGKIVDLD